ncbi:unnamed protein product [Closterium sp. Yama58-4]|nr:unnamed protein product [Closterium sp. Yama58-4]
MGLFSGFVSRSSGYHPASILEHEFDFSGAIGQGQFGTVWHCSSRATNQPFACKQICKSQFLSHSDHMRQVSREIEAMQKLQGHANVVDLHSVYENDAFIFLLMELCPDGDLFKLISERNGLPETEARYVFKRVALAVQHCHRNGIVHRDIKPENILLRDPSPPSDETSTAHPSLDGPICPLPHAHDTGSSAALACGCAPSREWEVKLADFGLSRSLDKGSRVRGRVGSYPYEAPEVVASEPYDWSADVWSLGVLLYTMLAASWPEFKDGRRALNEDVDWSSPSWRLVSDAAKSLIRRMMTVKPCERPTIDEVLCDAWLCDESILVNAPTSIYVDDSHAMASIAVEVTKTFEAFKFIASLPSVKNYKDGVLVEEGTNLLTISNERSCEAKQDTENHRVGRSTEKFLNHFWLPDNVEVDKSAACTETGVLAVMDS